MCAPRVLALCLLAGLGRDAGVVGQAGRAPAAPFAPRAPSPKPAIKTLVSKGLEQTGVAPAQAVTAISRFPLKVFHEHAKPPIPFRFPSPLNRMQFKSKIIPLETHNRDLTTKAKEILRWKIAQANSHQPKASQITEAGNLLQWKLPEANRRLLNGIQITEDSRREHYNFKYNNRRKISHNTETMSVQRRILEVFKELIKEPQISEVINNKEPMKKSLTKIQQANMRLTFTPSIGLRKEPQIPKVIINKEPAKKSLPKIPRADMGLTFTPSTGLQNEPQIPKIINNKEQTKKSRAKIPRADMGLTFTPSTGLQKEPQIPKIINNKEPTKKSRSKIPRADLGLTFTPSTGLQNEPQIPKIINNKEPTKKSRPKIPRADMGLTLTPSTGKAKSQTAEVLKNPVTKNSKPPNHPKRSKPPKRPKHPGVKGPVKIKPSGTKSKSKTPGRKKKRPAGPKLPVHRNVKAAAPTLRNASMAPGLRQREINMPTYREMKTLIMKLMTQVLYTTQTDELPVVEATANRHAQDTRFRMAFIFLRLDELVHEMHTMYTYLRKNDDDYHTQGVFKWWTSPVYVLRNRVHLTYYTHIVRRNVDITYAVEYLLELCKSTDRQMERMKHILNLTTPPP